MKNNLAILILLSFFAGISRSGATPTIGQNNVQIHDVRVDHNETEGGRKGMRIHIDFTIRDKQHRKCSAVAYFAHADGGVLYSADGDYRASDGSVCVSENFTPPHSPARQQNFTLFMPYAEMHLDGEYRLRFWIGFWNNGEKIGSSGQYFFTLNWNSAPDRPAPPPVVESEGAIRVDLGRCSNCEQYAVVIQNVQTGYYRMYSARTGNVLFQGVPTGTYKVYVDWAGKSGDRDYPSSFNQKQVQVYTGQCTEVRL